MAKKNTDETILDVQEVYTNTELFIENNKKTLLGILIAIIVLIVGFFVYSTFFKNPALASANEEAHLAEMYFMMDSLDAAKDGTAAFIGFEEIAEIHAGTAVGMRANYHLGVINRDNGDFEAALENFKNADFNSPLLGAMVNGNTGDCLVEIGMSYEEGAEQDSKLAEALPYFKKAANSSPDEITTQVYFKKAANVCLQLGRYNEAIKMYDGIMKASTNAKSTEYKDAVKMKAMAQAKAAQQ
ncbi:MAG: tetratricopeptide repeat protein [Flavobacteriales bacterium]